MKTYPRTATNNAEIRCFCWMELTEKEQTYGDEPDDITEDRYFRWCGKCYDRHDFSTMDGRFSLYKMGWQHYLELDNRTGVVFRYVNRIHFEDIIVGNYTRKD